MSVDGIYHSACQVGRGDSGSGGGTIHFHSFGFFPALNWNSMQGTESCQERFRKNYIFVERGRSVIDREGWGGP